MNQSLGEGLLLSLPFIEAHRYSKNIALYEDTTSLTYADLANEIQQRALQWQRILPLQRPIVIIFIDNTINGVIDYLTALSLNYVVLLLNPDCSEETVQQYLQSLQPNARVSAGELTFLHSTIHSIDQRVSLLLSTSGSTGAGKCVALSNENIMANCKAIISYLPISSQDITLATLPLSYSYGLSVLHTHLQVGASICFTHFSVFDKPFWELIKQRPIHSLAGVPSFYDMLLRLRFTQMDLPALRYFTQAGGRLGATQVSRLAGYAKQNKKMFYVMYGQTEATARMSFLAPEKAAVKPESIGQAIPGGEFKLEVSAPQMGKQNIPVEQVKQGELYYRGANVMLGYVATVVDLQCLTPSEWLATGDIAVRDEDGDYSIVGRTKRMVKIVGERVNLDVIEKHFLALLETMQLPAAGCIVGQDDKIMAVYSGRLDTETYENLVTNFAASLKIPKRNLFLKVIDSLPLLSSGKIDYTTLNSQLMDSK